MPVAVDGTQAAVIMTPSSGSTLTLKSGANALAWTLTFPTGPGTAGQVLTTDGAGNLSWGAGGGGGTPAAPVNSVQFNNAGSFGGSANFVWDNTSGRLGVNTSSPTGEIDARAASGSLFSRVYSINNNALAGASASFGAAVADGGGIGMGVFQAGGSFVTSAPASADMEIGTTNSRPVSLFANNGGSGAIVSIQPTGNVGVGTITPAHKLDVDGDAYADHVGANAGIFLNADTISANFTIPAGMNGLSSGPVNTIGGAIVTVLPGRVWKVV